jgi:hypothetical protein
LILLKLYIFVNYVLIFYNELRHARILIKILDCNLMILILLLLTKHL